MANQVPVCSESSEIVLIITVVVKKQQNNNNASTRNSLIVCSQRLLFLKIWPHNHGCAGPLLVVMRSSHRYDTAHVWHCMSTYITFFFNVSEMPAYSEK